MLTKVCLLLFVMTIALRANSQKNEEWPFYGNDEGGSRYSPLNQVNDQSVRQLTLAWTFHTGELETYKGTDATTKAAFEATPLMVDGKLYFSTPTDRVFAIDAKSGTQVWSYDPKISRERNYSEITSRGVAIWPAKTNNKSTGAPKIVFIGTIDGRLIAINADNGKPRAAFGDSGIVDLKVGYGGNIQITSPPAVIGELVIVGSSLGDNTRARETSGAVRAFDVQTGKLRWAWDPIPRDSTDTAYKTWENAYSHKTGAANVWSMISTDSKNNLVFVPTTSPSPDYYGGERLGQNLYGNSIVALNASSGKLVWYFQVVHHDLWDYDIAAQPVLVDVPVDGKKVAAVIVGTKMGHLFVLDRLNGKPLFPVEERPVPASTVPGEKAWPTQPFPIKPAPLGLQQITEDDAWGITEEDRAASAERISKLVNKGIFTPPSIQGSIMTPGNTGGIHWGGMCYDKQKDILLTNINRFAAVIKLIPRNQSVHPNNNQELLYRVERGLQNGTPYTLERDYLFVATKDEAKMQFKPPWGTLLGIDMNTQDKIWEVPLGFMMNPKQYPQARQWGSINFGGAIATAGNLTIVAATFDGFLRFFNTQTGQLMREIELPAGGQATPMTYTINGKQFVVIAAGGHGKLRTKLGDSVVAYALP